MQSHMVVNFAFRLPRFPVVIDTGDRLIAAESKVALAMAIQDLDIADESKRRIIDLNGENFAYYPKNGIIAPSISIRKCKKIDIIELYDARKTSELPRMRRTSLGNRTVEDVIREVVQQLLTDMKSSGSKQVPE